MNNFQLWTQGNEIHNLTRVRMRKNKYGSKEGMLLTSKFTQGNIPAKLQGKLKRILFNHMTYTIDYPQ